MEPRTANAYRLELGKRVEVPRRDPFRLVQFWVLVAAFVGLQFWVVNAPSWALAALASVPLGLILVALFMLLHELMHYAVVGNRTVAWLHAWVAGFYAGLTPDSWKNEHDAHHNALGTAIEDPDAVYDLETWKQKPGVRKGIVLLPGNHSVVSLLSRPFWWVAVHAQLLFTRYLAQPNVSRGKKALAVGVYVFDVSAQLALFAWLGGRYALWGYLVPVCVHNLFLMYFLLGTHLTSRRSAEKDPLLGSMSMRFHAVWRWAFMDSGRHTEHHLFPQTTHRKLREVTEVLRGDFGDRFQEVSFGQTIRALESSGRVYVGDLSLWDPATGRTYTTFVKEAGVMVPPKVVGRLEV